MIPCRSRPMTALLAFLIVCPSARAQQPTTIDQVPVFPGATRAADREAEVAQASDAGDGSTMTVRVYRAAAWSDDLVRFYQQRLRARVPTEDDLVQAEDLLDELEPGGASPVWLDAVVAPLEPAEARAVYARTRQPYRPNEWIESATFSWVVKHGEDRRTEFTLTVEDTDVWELLDPGYHAETEITIQASTWGESVADEDMAQERSAPLPMPSERDMGVPFYPGARFNGQMSADMSANGDAFYWVFSTTDPPDQVARFYEGRTGKQGLETESGTLIAVQGEGPFPELGVYVQPNLGTFPPPARTVLTIRKEL